MNIALESKSAAFAPSWYVRSETWPKAQHLDQSLPPVLPPGRDDFGVSSKNLARNEFPEQGWVFSIHTALFLPGDFVVMKIWIILQRLRPRAIYWYSWPLKINGWEMRCPFGIRPILKLLVSGSVFLCARKSHKDLRINCDRKFWRSFGMKLFQWVTYHPLTIVIHPTSRNMKTYENVFTFYQTLLGESSHLVNGK